MKQLITGKRIRRIISDATTDADIISVLRSHNIKYSYSTMGGTLHIQIPGRKGIIRIYNTTAAAPGVCYPFPVLSKEY